MSNLLRRIIYDLGSNNGDDIPYYLQKADLVVAVEANPVLASEIRNKFGAEIDRGRLAVEDAVLTVGDTAPVSFFVHRAEHVRSQFPPPPPEIAADFDEVILPAIRLADLIERHGTPYYVKIDIEHYDKVILEALFTLGVKPLFLSAEAHDVDVFCSLVAQGGYKAFKLVNGRSVANDYKDASIETVRGTRKHSFPHHSAGPFGDDIRGDWLDANSMFELLSEVGFGWKDIHVTQQEVSLSSYRRPRGRKAALKRLLSRR